MADSAMDSGRRGSLAAARQLHSLHQGELDGLCGIYAAVNALRLLLADEEALSGINVDAVFHRGLKVLDIRGELPEAVNHGVCKSSWRRMVTQMVNEAAQLSDRRVRRRRPFARARRPSRQRLFAVIEAAIDRQQPVLIALSGRHSHYTVICGYSPTRLTLFDSNVLRWLDRAGCGPRHDGRAWRHRIGTRSLTILELAP